MPELPEVETIRCGLNPRIKSSTIEHVTIRCGKLRYPVNSDFIHQVRGKKIDYIARRSKYLKFHFAQANSGILCHLGMSGSLSLVTTDSDIRKHDHIDLHFTHYTLRYHDPRRFGLLLFAQHLDQHPLLQHLGPEPLSAQFSYHYFYRCLQRQRSPIKNAIMNGKNVVGVGNIYANEALFKVGLHPTLAAHSLSEQQVKQLVRAIKSTLRLAIRAGGSTLQDFVNASGKPGYFQHQHLVYGRAGAPCYQCQTPIQQIRLGQRSAFFCPHCQPLA